MNTTTWMRRAACALGLIAAAGLAGAQTTPIEKPPAPLPLSAFADLPLVADVELTPDGQRYAALMNTGGYTVLVTRELVGGGPIRPLLKTDNKEFRFAWLKWASNDRLVVSVHYPSQRGWTQFGETRLFSLKPDGTGLVNLVRRSAFRYAGRPAQFQDRVIDWLPEDGQHVLLQLDDDDSRLPSVFRVHLETGRRIIVHPGRGGIDRWMTDLTHRVRAGMGFDGRRATVQVCDPDGKNWRELWNFGLFDRDAVEPLGFGTDPNLLYVLADHEGRQAAFEVNLADPALPRRLLLSHPVFDVGSKLMRAPQTGEVIGIRSVVMGDSAAGIWAPGYKALLTGIDQALPGRTNALLQFSADGSQYLLYSVGNGDPGRYLVGTRKEGTLSLLADTYPGLADAGLSRKAAHMARARDGVELPVILTLPQGREPKNLPTVLLPHGGPISADSMVFDPRVQFLADRGYAVLQVNFRGSSGFGHGHMTAGLKRWGLEMQDDLSDALQWLVQRGTADPARVCIVGSNYGGYAALMGAAKTPELYRCAVSFAGVTDLLDLEMHQRDFVNGAAVFSQMVGEAWGDRDQLKATSPVRLADKIQAPVLLIHGTADLSVPFSQGKDMASALKRAGKRYRFIEQEDGDHHLGQQVHRTQFFRELEAFLAEHLGR
ncbi:MAG: alpha/beta hydrolase family protein [Pseudomonadota bacterium]